MQENALTAYAETTLSETSSPDPSQQSSGLDLVIKKVCKDVSSEMAMHTTELKLSDMNVHLTVLQQDQLCSTQYPGAQTPSSLDTPMTKTNTTAGSLIKEEDFDMLTEDEADRTCHVELNFETPTSSTQVLHTLDTLYPISISWKEKTVESNAPREKTALASCHLHPEHCDIHEIKGCHVSQDDQILMISPPSNPDQTENYTDDRGTDFINSRHEQRGKAGGEETPLAPCEPNPGRASESEPTPGRDSENMSSLIPVNSSGIDSKRSVCELETSFVNSSSKHRKGHKGEKPFMCGECGYRARKKCRLVDHMITHTGEKPFKCNQCNFKTPYERNLVDHMKKHTNVEPYSCEICEYQTYRKPDLERHMMGHTGSVKPYKCKDCDYRTAHKSHLTRHMRRHTGERYSCQECDCKTIDKSNLTRHMRKKHA